MFHTFLISLSHSYDFPSFEILTHFLVHLLSFIILELSFLRTQFFVLVKLYLFRFRFPQHKFFFAFQRVSYHLTPFYFLVLLNLQQLLSFILQSCQSCLFLTTSFLTQVYHNFLSNSVPKQIIQLFLPQHFLVYAQNFPFLLQNQLLALQHELLNSFNALMPSSFVIPIHQQGNERNNQLHPKLLFKQIQEEEFF